MALRKRSNNAPDTDAPTEANEPAGTLKSMYPASETAQREVQIDPDPPARPAHVTRPHANTFADTDNGVAYNAIGLRAGSVHGVFSTHRTSSVDRQAIERLKQEQEHRALSGLDRLLTMLTRRK